MKYTVRNAERFIAKNKSGVDNTFRPTYHFSPSIGWINDPNGLIKYKNRYHIFYQYYPYSTESGPMHWGHSVSDDLLSFSEVGVALAPDAKDENGCFSGGAETVGDELKLVYTRHRDRTDTVEQKETICLASSVDGVKFVKTDLPIFDNDSLPRSVDKTNFRDPYPVKIGDIYYVFVGGKEGGKGVIIVLSGKTPNSLEYCFKIGPFGELGCMAECPSYCRIDGKDVLVVSGVHEHERNNGLETVWTSYFIVGNIDFGAKTVTVDHIREIDRGDAFYAPQFVRYADQPTVIAWMENWGKRYPTRDLKHGWTGAFTVPREISIENGEVYQKPIVALEQKRRPIDEKTLPKSCDIVAKVGKNFKIRIAARDGSVKIGNDGDKIYLDTRYSNNLNEKIIRTEKSYGDCEIRILSDVSCIELFVAGGKEAISSRIYFYGDYRLEYDGDVKSLEAYEIC